jgi:hypothetical protein
MNAPLARPLAAAHGDIAGLAALRRLAVASLPAPEADMLAG